MKSDALDMKKSGLSRTTLARVSSVERAIAHIHDNWDEPQSLQTLAEIAALSPFHFNRVFHQVAGIPPVQFLYAVRLEAAKRLVLTTSLNVTDICFHVGYNSLGTFVSRFTKLVGTSPCGLRRAAAEFDLSELRRLCAENSEVLQVAPQRPGLTGRVEVGQHFSGLIFLGLFHAAIPNSMPLCCTVLTGSGHYTFGSLPNGDYYLLAAALPWTDSKLAFLLQEAPLRARSECIRVINGSAQEAVNLVLHSAKPANPPILSALPVMLTVRLGLWLTRSVSSRGTATLSEQVN